MIFQTKYPNENSNSAGFFPSQMQNTIAWHTHTQTHTHHRTKKWKILYWWIIGHFNWCRNSINSDFINTIFIDSIKIFDKWGKLIEWHLDESHLRLFTMEWEKWRKRERASEWQKKKKKLENNWNTFVGLIGLTMLSLFAIAFPNHRIVDISFHVSNNYLQMFLCLFSVESFYFETKKKNIYNIVLSSDSPFKL